MKNHQVRVTFFLPSLYGGGAERVVVNLVKEFVKRGISVELVLANVKGPYLREIPKEVKIIDLKSSRVLFSLPKLVTYFKKEKPEIFVSSLSHANIISVIAKEVAKTKTKLFLREDTTLSLAYRNSRSLEVKIMPLLMRLFYSYADLIIAVSKGVKDDLVEFVKIPEDRIEVIYNPIITTELFIKAEEPIDHPLFTPNSFPIILGVGRLTKAKDFQTLLKAFSIVRKEIDSRLVILGEGEERKNLEKLIKDLGIENDVWLPGFVDNPYKFMSKASVFVLSSIYEGFGNVLVEALALGCPVVSTDCPSGPGEILENGEYGKLVGVGDTEGLAKAILDIIRNHKWENQATIERAKMFEVDKIAAKYLDIIYERKK